MCRRTNEHIPCFYRTCERITHYACLPGVNPQVWTLHLRNTLELLSWLYIHPSTLQSMDCVDAPGGQSKLFDWL